MDNDVRGLFEATQRRQDALGDRLDALYDQMAEIKAVFTAEDGRTYTAHESALILEHKLAMKEGELMALWAEVEDLRNEMRAVRYLVTGSGRYGARAQPFSALTGNEPSPLEGNPG